MLKKNGFDSFKPYSFVVSEGHVSNTKPKAKPQIVKLPPIFEGETTHVEANKVTQDDVLVVQKKSFYWENCTKWGWHTWVIVSHKDVVTSTHDKPTQKEPPSKKAKFTFPLITPKRQS